jgi:putative phosphoribosyl transferase
MEPIFQDRREAGRQLAQALAQRGYAGEGLIVVGIPRGGLLVAAGVARALRAPLEVLLPRRLRSAANPELAIGAVLGDAPPLLDDALLRATGTTEAYLEQELREQRAEIARRERLYRGDRPFPDLRGRTVILIDDGIATGLTFQAALQGLRRQGAARLVAAVPVAPQASLEPLRGLADEVVCLATPEPFLMVSVWYREFGQSSDEEIAALLRQREAPTVDAGAAPTDACQERPVTLPVGAARLPGALTVPASAKAVVVFAHGSGSGRHSPRNAFVARVLQEAGFAALLFDLLEEAEAADRENVFDIDLLAERLLGATAWLRAQPVMRDLLVCYLGASTGAAAALQAAARAPEGVAAVVSRGGRPDLAAAFLPQVRAPTLLIVGGNDEPVIGLNEAAWGLLGGPSELVVVPGAGHVFEEPGTLEEVARLARDWFLRCIEGDRAVEAAPPKRTIAIPLTREQQLAIAAATGMMVGVLEIDAEALEAGELPWAQIPGLASATETESRQR